MKYTGVEAAREFVYRVMAGDHSLPLPDSTGHFSRVWIMGDKVLKISGRPGFGSGDVDEEDAHRCDGWRWFIGYVVRNPGCRYFPVVHHHEEDTHLDVVWAIMDKLTPLTRVKWGEVDPAGDRRDQRNDTWCNRMESALSGYDMSEYSQHFEVLPVWLRKLSEAAAEERAWHAGDSCLAADVHPANVMLDRHGRRILNDPFGFSV